MNLKPNQTNKTDLQSGSLTEMDFLHCYIPHVLPITVHTNKSCCLCCMWSDSSFIIISKGYNIML